MNNRRNFIKKAAAAGMAGSMVAFAGCSTGAAPPSSYKTTSNIEVEATNDAVYVEVSGEVWVDKMKPGGADKVDILVSLKSNGQTVGEREKTIYLDREYEGKYGVSFQLDSGQNVNTLTADCTVLNSYYQGDTSASAGKTTTTEW